MEFGMDIPCVITDDNELNGEKVREFADIISEYEFNSCWMGEHIVKPESFDYYRSELLTTLAAVAGMTENVAIGSGVLLLPLRNPVLVAKAAATIQWLSDGRFTLGVGMGYARNDFSAVGVPYQERSRRFTEGLQLLNKLVTQESVTFDGDFYEVEDVTIEPTPAEPPRILLGGGGVERDGERFVPRAVKERLVYADGWIATSGATPDMVAEDWKEFAAFLREEGHNPDTYDLVAADRTYIVPDATTEKSQRIQLERFEEVMGPSTGVSFAKNHYSMGSVDDIVESLESYRAVGADEIKITFASLNPEEILNQVEYCGEYILPRLT